MVSSAEPLGHCAEAEESRVRIAVLTGTTREGRFSEKVAAWVTAQLRAAGGLELEEIDLRDFDLPFFDGPPPARRPRSTPTMPHASSVRRSTTRTAL